MTSEFDVVALHKEQLAAAIVAAVEGWSQTFAAHILGVDQPRVSDLRAGRLARFSLDYLVRLLDRIGGEAHITVEWTDRRRGLRF